MLRKVWISKAICWWAKQSWIAHWFHSFLEFTSRPQEIDAIVAGKVLVWPWIAWQPSRKRRCQSVNHFHGNGPCCQAWSMWINNTKTWQLFGAKLLISSFWHWCFALVNLFWEISRLWLQNFPSLNARLLDASQSVPSSRDSVFLLKNTPNVFSVSWLMSVWACFNKVTTGCLADRQHWMFRLSTDFGPRERIYPSAVEMCDSRPELWGIFPN